VGRYGGEEFIVIAPGCGPDRCQVLAERLRDSIQAVPIPYHANSISITASLGVSCVTGTTSADDLLRSADEALYRAKVEGRNRVVTNSTQFASQT
jgi:diguanylate cyclase (GGDEF)-like protein